MLHQTMELVRGFNQAGNGPAIKSRELTMQLLEHTAAPFDRMQYLPGHITCTGLVVSPARDEVLFVHHARLNRWLLPGGHVELEDCSPYATAAREVCEETSVLLNPVCQPFLAGLDVHGIPPAKGEPFHLHHDLIVGFLASYRDVARSEESHDVAWLKVAQFASFEIPESIRVSVLFALALV